MSSEKQGGNNMKIAFFDAKPYDKPSFEKYGEEFGVEFKFFETISCHRNKNTHDVLPLELFVCIHQCFKHYSA